MRGVGTSLLAVSLLCIPAVGAGQVEAPAPVSNTMPTSDFGFNLPTHSGTLSYALSGSELLETGAGNGSVNASTALSGDLAYLSTSDRFPTSLVYSGGVLFTTVPGNSSTETFQDFAASQVAQTKSWVFVVSDSLSYLPGSPTTGLSGVAGVGDVGVFPVQSGIGPQQSILTNFSTRLSNGLEGSATWQTTPSLSFEGSGSWQVLHFTGNNPGADTEGINATFGPTYRIDARTSVGAEVYYSKNTFPGYSTYEIESDGANVTFTRAWTRRVSTTFSFGPARTHGTTVAPIPGRWDLAGSAQVSYATRTTGLYASYSRSVNGGSGIVYGALSDTISGGMSRPINRDWNLGIQGSYSRSASLIPFNGVTPTYNTSLGSAQVARRLTESLSCYASYTGLAQSSANQPGFTGVTGSAFNGFNNIFGIGITFAPAPLLRGR